MFMLRLEIDRESVSNSQGLNDGGFWRVGFDEKISTVKHVDDTEVA